MRSARSVAFLVCLVAPAVAVAAQEAPRTMPVAPPMSAAHATHGVQQGERPAARLRSHSDSYWYGRFGYGTIAGESAYGGLLLGFGRRIERGAVGIDLSVATGQAKLFGTQPDLHTIGGIYTHAYAASLLTLKGLYFVRPRSRTTAYLGVGAGWRAVSFGRIFGIPDKLRSPSTPDIDEQWHGKGLESELTVGYALARAATSTRFFVQIDMTRPFYRAKRYSNRKVVIGDRYAPSLVGSIGVGW